MSGSATEDFRSAWDAHHPRVRQYLARRVTTDDIDELTSQVFEVAWRRWSEVPSGDKQLWWLLATARRTVGNHYRTRRRRGNLIERLAASSREHFDDVGWMTVENILVRDVLSKLGKSDREVLMLSVWDDLDSEAIGVVLGISTEAAQKRVVRARERFKVLFEKSTSEVSDGDSSRTLKR